MISVGLLGLLKIIKFKVRRGFVCFTVGGGWAEKGTELDRRRTNPGKRRGLYKFTKH